MSSPTHAWSHVHRAANPAPRETPHVVESLCVNTPDLSIAIKQMFV
jgi:hypothetical protein